MTDFKFDGDVKKRFQPFMDEILSDSRDKVHSIYITGSALTSDFDPKHSDINSIFVLNRMELKFLEKLAPLGKKYGKKKVSAPLIMTPEYIKTSLDVFPIEFQNIKLLHHCVFGEDVFADINIDRADLRHQCERELKVKLISLRQGYISASGDRKLLTDEFIRSFSGYMPLFKGIILLLGSDPPINNEAVLSDLETVSGVGMAVFKLVLKEKKERTKLSIEELNTIFEDYYAAIEKLGDMIDEMEA